MAVAAPRGRADRDEYGVGLANRLGEIGREIEPLLPRVPHHQAVKVRLEYGHFALAQPRYPVFVLIDAGDVVTEIRKAGARHKSHISGAYHGNAHETSQVLAAQSIASACHLLACLRAEEWLGCRIGFAGATICLKFAAD